MSKKIIQKYIKIPLKSLGYVGWTGLAIFGGGSLLLGLAIRTLTPDVFQIWLSSTAVGSMVGYALSFTVATLVVLLPYKAIKKLSWTQLFEKIGLKKPPTLEMAAWALFVWGLFFVTSIVVVMVVQALLPGVDMSESQDVGFSSVAGFGDKIAAFVALVVLAPVLEEVIFRGFLYGRLRENYGVIISSVVTSLVFGLAHMQVNVGIVVFVLSLFMCYLRERFDSVWPTVLLHALKNGLAFVLLFMVQVSV